MARGLTIAAMLVAAVLLILFGADLAIKVPFRRESMMLDIVFVICALGLGYIGWNAFKDVR